MSDYPLLGRTKAPAPRIVRLAGAMPPAFVSRSSSLGSGNE